ncbi:hypothetical protein PICMEDRAFT_15291 [Pichia membranifaciens NRRL Y-2026]|uniref:Phosphomevalonate kinase n=1 Tax=Pichia membranifaciens NRRL Y-2026 TaxID=763406 RepID=A0A1E3NP63_9ASCO|nr:hypothetical protein PICMEDRAFT_15291 [Pichia membranifaciens NRRL Y-2026]ODQ47323.1 hypothetical protein PICMEDRAFT_15291 [Pichia membranifaciens NRRL Y-2026]
MVQRAFSATGKALLAGGYLVLDPKYEAFVIALSARMYALNSVFESEAETRLCRITVNSPQFMNGSWSYTLDLDGLKSAGLAYPIVEKEGKRNPFIESTILVTVGYALEKDVLNEKTKAKDIHITIFSDPEYHSQLNSVRKESTNRSKQFLYHNKEITQVNKTGLGSSAGLVTSLTASLLSALFADFDIAQSSLNWKERVHNLAQVSHCKAQGKIGSGFDVASATFGSIIYQRFSPQLIHSVLDAVSDTNAKLVDLIDNQDWNMKHELCSMPPGIRLLMGDVIGGSETPKLVTKVQNWRKEKPEYSYKVWTELNSSNMRLVEALRKMDKLSETDKVRYSYLLNELAKNSDEDIASSPDLAELNQIGCAIKDIRKYLKIMTEETGAEIEPFEQTELLNAATNIKGVLGGVVPGAGGYDAICLLVSSEKLPQIFQDTSSNPSFGHVRWMNLAEQRDGLIEESYSNFAGLI